MNKAADFLRGKKTYGVAVMGGLYLLGCYVGWFQFDEKVCAALGIGFVATFRSALSGLVPAMTNDKGANDKGNPNKSDKTDATNMQSGALAVLIGVGLSGCALMDRAATAVTRPGSVVTNVVATVVTNFVPVAVRVEVPGPERFVTNIVEHILTNTVERATTNYVLKSEVTEGLRTAQTGAAVAGVFNPGAGAIASGVFGIAAAGLGLLARRKNQQAIDATAEAESLALQLQAAVEGVEKAGGVLSESDAKNVKETISKVSQALGVAAELHTSVQAITN
jgi:hypothetical protein